MIPSVNSPPLKYWYVTLLIPLGLLESMSYPGFSAIQGFLYLWNGMENGHV